MNELDRRGLKETLAKEVIDEAEAIMQRIPERDRTRFAMMYCLDAAARVVMDRKGVRP